MARINAELAQQREKMVFDHFYAHPDASVKEFNTALAAEHGFRMNLAKIYKIRNEAVAKASNMKKEQQA